MTKHIGKTAFFGLVFCLGVIIGSVKTPDIIAFNKAMNADNNSDEQETEKKAKPLPKRLRKSVRVA